jgi:putative DNA primase/helicase
VSRPHPPGFDEWPDDQRNAWFAEAARQYRQRQAKPVGRLQADEPSAKPQPSAAKVELIRADSVRPEPISWLWRGWLAKGKPHILGGAPGTGKTTIALSFAATVTNRGVWPDGSRCSTPGRVVIWSGEDDPSDTLVPRLMAAEADLSRVDFVTAVRQDGKARSFDPARDIEPLRDAIKLAGGASLLIVDPVVSAVAGDSHKNSETRRALQPLVQLASELDAALIGVTHFSKGTVGRDPVERLTGSIAFGALARIVLVAAKCQSPAEGKEAERFLCRAKSNIGNDTGGFAYELLQAEPLSGIEVAKVTFGKPIEGTAREILGEAEATSEDGRISAEDFLITLLTDGAKAVGEIREAAKAHCLPWRSVERAKSRLGVRAPREGFGKGGVWRWEPPDTFHRPPHASLDRQSICSTVYGEDGGLCANPSDSDYMEIER